MDRAQRDRHAASRRTHSDADVAEGDGHAIGEFRGFGHGIGTSTAWCRLYDPQAKLDLGGIAKGWIADRLAGSLQAAGFENFLIDLGGNTLMHGRRSSHHGWPVAIPNPCCNAEKSNRTLIPLTVPPDVSIVTSGTCERRFVADGITYHRIIDPHTGYPAHTDLASATIVARKSLDAEGYSTTLLALGSERASQFAARHPEILGALLIRNDGTVLRVGSM